MHRLCGLFSLMAIITLLPQKILAQAPDILWTKTYGTNYSEGGMAVQQTNDGGYIIVGSAQSHVYYYDDVYIIKTDSIGDTLWTKTYGGSNSDNGHGVQQTFDGGYIVVGYTNSFVENGEVYLIKIDTLGNHSWTRTYGGVSGVSYAWGYAVQQTSDSGYIVAGCKCNYSEAFNCDIYLIKIDVNGNTEWANTYGDTACYEVARSVHQTSDGGFIVIGSRTNTSEGYGDVYLIKTYSSGDTAWTKVYTSPEYEEAHSGQQTLDGGYIVTGWTAPTMEHPDADIFLMKTDEFGNMVWWRLYGGSNRFYGESVRQTADGGYIFVGGMYSTPGSQRVYLVRTEPNGDVIYGSEYSFGESAFAFSVQQTADSGFIIAGYTYSSGVGSDVLLIKTAGGDLWLTSPNGGESLPGGSLHQIRWYSVTNGISSYALLLSIDSGASYIDTIAYNISPDSTSWFWTLPIINSSNCRVKIQAFDSFNQVIYEDESNNNFSIVIFPTIVTPNGGECLLGDSTYSVTWSTIGTGFTNYTLLLSTDGGNSYTEVIAENISPDSSYWNWWVPNIDCSCCRVKIIILSVDSLIISEDESDSNFTIYSTTGVKEEFFTNSFLISQDGPNPFRDKTLIKYVLSKCVKVNLVLYDLTGKEIRTLLSKVEEAGLHQVCWDGCDNSGEQVPCGVYFLKFNVGEYTTTKKLLKVR